jgi:proline racemase
MPSERSRPFSPVSSRPSSLTIRTIDAHVAGQPVRLIVGGMASPRGRTMTEKGDWLQRRVDHVRRALILEPRGHVDMTGALLTEPITPGSHAGILFLDNVGYAPMSGTGVMAATAIALSRGLIVPGGDGLTIVYDTPAGTVRAALAGEAGQAGGTGHVTFTNVPAFVLHAGLEVNVASGFSRTSSKASVHSIRADIAFGGAFYAIVDSEATGIPLDMAHVPELRRAGMEIARAIERAHDIVHSLEPALSGLHGTIFTGPPSDDSAALRSATVMADAAVNRSPGGTGTSAVMAVVDAMGLLGPGAAFVHESLLGTRLTGRVAGRAVVGEHAAIVTEIEGSAWLTGEHTFVIDDDDPLRDGFRLG